MIWTTILSIGFSIGTLITSLALMNGFQGSVLNRILHIYGHMDVYSNTFENDISSITKKPWYKKHIRINEKQAILSHYNETQGVKLIGMNSDGCNYIIQNKWVNKNDNIKSTTYPIIMVGQKLAQAFGLSVGSEVKLFLPNSLANNQISIAPLNAKVGGIFKLGFHSFDKNVIFVIGNALDKYSLGFEQKQYVFYTDTPDQIDKIATDIKKLSNNHSVWTWKEINPSLKQMFNMQNIILAVFIGMFIICCMMQSTNSLWMLISERVHDISLLKAFGASNFQIFSLFAYLSLFISIGSIMCGLSIGLLLTYLFPRVYTFIHKNYGYTMIHEESFGFSEFYPKIIYSELFMICAVSFVVMMLILTKIAKQANNVDIIQGLN
ncbi:MAG: ABC transporter permease [Alphaproteobacteria bacterium]|nr:MAG: ABC transporter permease [Alphaproteobacteria bacterium]